jgi:hypothetical protein
MIEARRHIIRRHLALAALAASALPGLPTPALALERTRTPTGDIPVIWDRTPVPLLVEPAPQLPHVAPAAVLADLRASAVRWSRGRNSCTSFVLNIETTLAGDPPPEAMIDYANRLVIRRDRWCNPAKPDACHNPAALAITTVTARKSDGVLLDVDIELNATRITWGDLVANDPSTAGGAHDLQAAMTHEFGHFLGFDHSCRLPGEPPANNIPACAEADSAALASVMFPVESPREGPRRDPTPEDLQSLCAIYPALPDTILGDGSVGCTTAGTGIGRGNVKGMPSGWLIGLSALLSLSGTVRLVRLARRCRVRSTAASAMSLPANRQPWATAASPVDPEPMNGSTTSSPRAALCRTSRSSTGRGFSAG